MFELIRYLIEAMFISFQKTDQNVIFLFAYLTQSLFTYRKYFEHSYSQVILPSK